jgi:hypothetical protein
MGMAIRHNQAKLKKINQMRCEYLPYIFAKLYSSPPQETRKEILMSIIYVWCFEHSLFLIKTIK